MPAAAPIVARALALLDEQDLVLALHDPSFPSAPGEHTGRGSPYARGGREFLAFAAGLGFTGVQFGPQGQSSAGKCREASLTRSSARRLVSARSNPIARSVSARSIDPSRSLMASTHSMTP